MNSAEVYLLLTGSGGVEIQGEVQSRHYENQIALSTWSWDMSLGEASRIDQGADQVEGGLFEIKKSVDAASTTMMQYLEEGKWCDKATITMLQRSDASIALRIDLRHVRLMSVDLTINNGEKSVDLTEKWTLSFKEVEILYKGDRKRQDVRGALSNSQIRGHGSFEMTMPKHAHVQSTSQEREDDARHLAYMDGLRNESSSGESRSDDELFGYE